MSAIKEAPLSEKDVHASSASPDIEHGHGEADVDPTQLLHRSLQGRHMQMIAIGGSIGAGLFVSSGGSLSTGGPGSLVSLIHHSFVDFKILMDI